MIGNFPTLVQYIGSYVSVVATVDARWLLTKWLKIYSQKKIMNGCKEYSRKAIIIHNSCLSNGQKNNNIPRPILQKSNQISQRKKKTNNQTIQMQGLKLKSGPFSSFPSKNA